MDITHKYFPKDILKSIGYFADLFSMANLLKTCKHYHNYKNILMELYNTYIYVGIEKFKSCINNLPTEIVSFSNTNIKRLKYKYYVKNIYFPNASACLKINMVHVDKIPLLLVNTFIKKMEYIMDNINEITKMDNFCVKIRKIYFKNTNMYTIVIVNMTVPKRNK